MVIVMIQFDGNILEIPVNPENIKISREADNKDLDIIGLGKTVRKGYPSLIKTSIESFFPSPTSYFYTGMPPKDCVEIIEKIWKTENTKNNVGKIVTIGLPIELNMYFVIESFEYDSRAGEEEDIYYTLNIKQYVPYGAKVVTKSTSGLASARAVSPVSQVPQTQPTAIQKTYTVVRGDCLWNITKKYTGNGNNWRDLYNLNKEVIGNNPNLIYPNQVLTLPSGW